jgi:hypothetical protein
MSRWIQIGAFFPQSLGATCPECNRNVDHCSTGESYYFVEYENDTCDKPTGRTRCSCCAIAASRREWEALGLPEWKPKCKHRHCKASMLDHKGHISMAMASCMPLACAKQFALWVLSIDDKHVTTNCNNCAVCLEN